MEKATKNKLHHWLRTSNEKNIQRRLRFMESTRPRVRDKKFLSDLDWLISKLQDELDFRHFYKEMAELSAAVNCLIVTASNDPLY